MEYLQLEQVTIAIKNVSMIEWGKNEVVKEAMPTNTTELTNPIKVESPKVAIVRFVGDSRDSSHCLIIDRSSDDFKKIKSAFGRE